MNVPHRGAGAGRSQPTDMAVAGTVKKEFAPGKRVGLELPRGTCECAAEVIVGVGMPSRKPWTAATQDGCDLWRGGATLQQFFGDPFIGDAPVGLWEAVRNPQPLQPTGIDGGGIGDGGRARPLVDARHIAVRGRRRQAGVTVHLVLGRFQQPGALGSQTGTGMQHLHPRRVATPVAPLRFLIGEASQAAQMTPIGAGRVATVEVGQLFSDVAGNRGLDGRGTHLYPSLKVTGAGLEYHAWLMPIASHGFDDGGTGVIQIDEDVTRIAILRAGMEVHVAAFAVAAAQESDNGRMGQLGRGPHLLSGECPSGLGVDETNEIDFVRHGRELAAYSPRGEAESTVEHGLNFGIERTAVQ
jgi:hypothetical protein